MAFCGTWEALVKRLGFGTIGCFVNINRRCLSSKQKFH
jgi:hypothetical protein